MKPLTKNLWRNIRDSLGRFIAIVIIIMLGVLLFVGVKATGPALKDSLNTTVKADHLADSQLLATTGVSKAQVKAAESVSGVQAEAVKFKYVIGGRASDVVALYGYQKWTTINRLHLTSGQLPTQANQIVLDTAAKKSGYQLGQTYTFTGGSKLARRTFKISGFADSPAYIEDTSRGSANIGDGTVRYFAYIPASQMKIRRLAAQHSLPSFANTRYLQQPLQGRRCHKNEIGETAREGARRKGSASSSICQHC